MGRTATSERFIEHDAAIDCDGNTGRVVNCFNKSRREYFLSIKVIDGPRKGQWDKLYRYTPKIDHDGGTLRTDCLTCGRGFLAVPRVLADLGGMQVPKQAYCRTCLPLGQKTERAVHGAVEEAPVRDVLHRPWRLHERTTPVESKAPAVRNTAPHPANCLCGETPSCTPFGAPECPPHDGEGRR